MADNSALSQILLSQWQEIRRLSYDYLDMLAPAHLDLTLPFPESKSLGYQFWCMLGAQESYLRKLKHGAWQGFASSLDQFDPVTPDVIAAQMKKADAKLETLLDQVDATATLKNGQPAYEVLFQMLKHEMHHHGQLINFLYCHHLPIPDSWRDEWALSYD